MLSLKEELRCQLQNAASKMMLKPRYSAPRSSENKQRNGLRRFNHRGERKRASSTPTTTPTNTRPKSRKQSNNKNAAMRKPIVRKVERTASLGVLDLFRDDNSLRDVDETHPEDFSSSTYTMVEDLGTSYNGFLGGSSHRSHPIVCAGNTSFSHLLQKSNVDLDCIDLLIITNVWERVKRLEGYPADFCEVLICQMMVHSEYNVRSQLGITSFRSERFVVLANKLVDLIEVFVTMLGPEMDENELLEVGQGLLQQGVNLKLFGKSMAPAMREILGEDKFPKDDFDICDRIFRRVCSRIIDG